MKEQKDIKKLDSALFENVGFYDPINNHLFPQIQLAI